MGVNPFDGRESDFLRARRSEDAALRAFESRKREPVGHNIDVRRLDAFGQGYSLVRGSDDDGNPCLVRVPVK